MTPGRFRATPSNTKEQIAMRAGHVTTEGDTLYYEVRGNGPALLMIAGAGGDADVFSAVADILCDEYKVITYDRRANARSTMHLPQNFEISQQSRDAVAVLAATGETSGFVFGSSSGAVIALDVAKAHPQVVRAVVAHEPPLARLHPNAKKWQRFFANVYRMAFRLGSSLAGLRFVLGIQVPVLKLVKGNAKSVKYAKVHRERGDEPRINSQDAGDVLIKQELLPVTNYLPDMDAIKLNGVNVFMAVGDWALRKRAWLADTTEAVARELGCELATFPGHHGAHTDMPKEWAAALRAVLHKADETRATEPRD